MKTQFIIFVKNNFHLIINLKYSPKMKSVTMATKAIKITKNLIIKSVACLLLKIVKENISSKNYTMNSLARL